MFFFNTVNPTFKNGGFINVSKKAIYNLIPDTYYPKTVLVFPNTSYNFKALLKMSNITFPVIVKPDKGLRGVLVKKLESIEALEAYHQKASFEYLIQEYVDYPYEAGIFYVKKPNQSSGTITGIVQKEFLTVTGDGTSTIEQLLKKNPRFEFQIPILKKHLAEEYNYILKPNCSKILVPFGNHCRGSMFMDANKYITPKLIQNIDAVCQQIDGFYYGRIDLKFKSWSDLNEGQHFSIIEINGAMSEPAHIYDPNNPYLKGLKEIIRHYHHLFEISRQNHALGLPFLGYKEAVKEFKEHFATMSNFTKVSQM